MLRSSSVGVALLASLLAGCAHYQAGQGYQGAGNFRVSSDYAQNSTSTSARASRSPAAYDVSSTFQLNWPVRKIHINRGFHPANDPNHEGIDLGGRRNTPIYAAHDGRVIYAGHRFHGYGRMIMVEFDDHWATLYGHLNRIEVRQGQRVSIGQEIGKMGRTGHATGVHLHFELMKDHLPVNPLDYLPEIGPSRRISSTRSN
jgi:murein DD-endopeptidase MepM/ murein hydrolase activator NlpD